MRKSGSAECSEAGSTGSRSRQPYSGVQYDYEYSTITDVLRWKDYSIEVGLAPPADLVGIASRSVFHFSVGATRLLVSSSR
jgi:hypothetical protein